MKRAYKKYDKDSIPMKQCAACLGAGQTCFMGCLECSDSGQVVNVEALLEEIDRLDELVQTYEPYHHAYYK